MRNLLVIDGNSIINRAFYGVRPLSTHTGKPTNAIFGMIHIIAKQLEALKPEWAAVAFDLREPTFRHRMYAEYKAGRHPTPDELLAQFDDAKEVLAAMGLHVLSLPGYEADDIQGTVAAMAGTIPGAHAYVLSGDRDLFQLISDSTTVLYAGNETIPYDRAAFSEKYPGIVPEQFVDLKALMGDASDHIPGVAGIGEKTALKLLSAYGSLDGVYEHADDPDVAKGIREKLNRCREDAYLSQGLARIKTDVPLGLTADDLVWHGFDAPRLYKILSELELNSLITRFHLTETKPEPEPQRDACTYQQATKEDLLRMSGKFAFHPCAGGFSLYDGVHFYVTDLPIREILPLFSQGNTVVCYDGKHLWHQVREAGGDAGCEWQDVALYSYVLNASSGTTALADLVASSLGVAVSREGPAAHLLYRLESVLSSKIEEIGCTRLLHEIELPLMPILAEMEETGFRVDRAGMAAFGEELHRAADACCATVQEMAGCAFNLNSPKQLGEVLFERLSLPAPKKKKGGYSTDAETLEKLRAAHPIVEEILLYRQLTKLYTTYAVGLMNASERDGRVHTDFKQALTATGRLSSAEPNLQNIPIRTPLGREMRRFFIPSDGCVLLDADYSQIELRLLAILSGDEAMTDAFLSGADIHTSTASTAFRVPPEEVTPELRKRAKAINFGIVYGIGAYSLSGDLHISVAEAKAYIDAYLQTYPRVGEYLEKTVEDARSCGYTQTLWGRRRYIPELTSANGAVRAFGRRVAMNAPLQGTAADIMKLAMVRVSRALRAELPAARLLMQVHDELVLECPAADAEKAAQILKREMEGVGTFAVPLTVSVTTGSNWLK